MRLACFAGLCLLLAAPARAQDFASPAPPGPAGPPLAFLETGLPPARSGPGIQAASTRWFGLPDLVTRSVAIAGSWRAARAAAGISQTGDPELGWTGLGMALGGAGSSGGGAVRAVFRRDRHPSPAEGPLGPGLGLEIGAAAWVAAGGGFSLWASAPQMWLRGAAPPLARGFELGAVLQAHELAAWFARRAPPAGDDADADHELGLVLDLGPWSTWARARDRPLRGGIGLAARARRIGVAFEVQSHPMLGESVLLSIAIPAPRGPK